MSWFSNIFGKVKSQAQDIIPILKEPEINLDGVTQQQLDFIFKYGQGSNKLGKYESKNFTELPYGIVRMDILTLQKKELHLEAIMMILECQFEKVSLKGVTQNDLFAFLVWMKKEQDKLFTRERNYLSSDPDPEAVAAGINRLDEFGALATIHTLAHNQVWRHKDIYNTPYFEIYQVLKLEKVQRDVQKAHQKIMEQKAKSQKQK